MIKIYEDRIFSKIHGGSREAVLKPYTIRLSETEIAALKEAAKSDKLIWSGSRQPSANKIARHAIREMLAQIEKTPA